MKRIDIDWNKVQLEHSKGMSINNICNTFHISRTAIETAVKYGDFIKIKHSFKHTHHTKSLISKKRKQWLLDNPDKHPWKKSEKFVSKPCELLKHKLRSSGIYFEEEFAPLKDRLFSIDIAFPCRQFGIEVNGNQHYDNGGNLKKYYQDRHNLITAQGWILVELHYLAIYNNDIINRLISDIQNGYCINDETYNKFDKYESKTCLDCGCEINRRSLRCMKCANIQKRKVERPNKETLKQDILNNTWTAIGSKYAVSDNTVRKWAKQYHII